MDGNVIGATIGAILGGLFGLGGIYYGHKLNKQKKETKSLNLLQSFDIWDSLKTAVEEVFEKTFADRFILFIIDGDNYLWVSAVWDEHNPVHPNVKLSVGARSRYEKIDTDEHYKSLIKELQVRGEIKLTTKSMPEGLLKRIYIGEKVEYSNLYFVYNYDNNKKNKRVLYYSIATHENIPFKQEDEMQFNILTNKLKHEILPIDKQYLITI
jgi:hypothetical protein